MLDKNRQKNEKFKDFSSQHVKQNKRFRKLKQIYDAIRKKYSNVPEILQRNELFLPDFIFCKKLSSLEAISKYLIENCGLSIKEASVLLNRTNKNIWHAYNSSKKKLKKFEEKRIRIAIPIIIFQNSDLSVLENVVVYLKDELILAYSQIAKILHRDDRTIWTVYNKASKKKTRKHNEIKKYKKISEIFVLFFNLAKRFSASVLLTELENQPFVPEDIFSEKLGSFESIVKFLVENYDLTVPEIAHFLNRPYTSIWNSYASSRKKFPAKFALKPSRPIPVSILRETEFGVLENIVAYLRDSLEFSFHKISVMISRDERTVWAAYKNKNEKMRKNEL
tara:strand:+ start:28114 stop:29121 length:1008 start_codon:yes stop_codon:yes gene_type:complete